MIDTLPSPPETKSIRKISGLLDRLDTLISENSKPRRRLSLYIAAGNLPNEVPDSRIRLKNALDSIQDSASDDEAQAVVKNVWEVVGDYTKPESEESDFWQNQMGGLAIFADADEVRILGTPKSFATRVTLANNWFLTPLLELAANVDCYWLLALSQNEVSLYRGSRLGMREIPLSEEKISFNTSETASIRSSGDDPELIDAEANKENLIRFFREFEPIVVNVIGDSDDPLLLAGVDFYGPLYESINTYNHLAKGILEGNPEHLSLDELHEKASEHLRPEFIESGKRELFRLKMLANSNLFESDLQEILSASATGRVKSLVAPSDKMKWGKITSHIEGTFEEFPLSEHDGYDLYQKAAERTLNHGGTLYYRESTRMPGGHEICAELRY